MILAKLTVLLVVLKLPIASAFGRCPKGWVFRHNSCYAVINDEQTWFEAQLFCTTIGGHLVEIDSEEENNYIFATARALEKAFLDISDGKHLWIGLNDLLQEMHFEWVNSRKAPVYTNWNTAEPNSAVGGNEDCVELLPEPYAGKWNDVPCRALFSSVCETS